MQTQSLTMINVCTCIRVFPNRWMGEWDVVPFTSRKFTYSSSTGKVPPKANFYSAPSKGASPTTEYQFSCCNLIKTLLLVVFIASVYAIFIFNFTLVVQIGYCHFTLVAVISYASFDLS